MQILRAAQRPASPWKNGGGETFEIAASPPGAGLDAFDWRISIACVRSSGGFSTFPGIDRVLAMLEGEVALHIEGQPSATLTPASPALAFPGDQATSADLLQGPAFDLNVMTRRGLYSAKLTQHTKPGVLRCEPGVAVMGLIALQDMVLNEDNSQTLHRFDAVIWEDDRTVRTEAGGFWLVEILKRH